MKLSNFQLIEKPSITKNIFIINKDFNFNDEISLEIDSDIKIIRASENEMSSLVILTLKFFENSNFKDVPFTLEMDIEAMFGWDEKLEKEPTQLEVLLKENAPAILYSYLRPIITATSVDANLPPLVIPLMNFRE